MIRRAAEFRPPAEVEAAVEKLRPWVDAQLVPNEHVGRTDRDGRPEGRLRALSPRRVTWAFIAWNTDEE